MKNNYSFLILSLFFICSFSVKAQLTGKLIQDNYPYPWVKVYFEGIKGKATSNFEGDFKLRIKDTLSTKTLNIQFEGLKIQILNCPLNSESTLELGNVILPKYKKVSIDEYKQMKRRYRKQCVPIYNSGTITGYISKTEIENDALILRCSEGKVILNFTLDPKTKIITLDWDTFMNCN